MGRLQFLLTALVLSTPAFSGNIILNGGFETNGGPGSSSFAGWTVVNESGSGGSWYVQTGTTSPTSGFPVSAPTEGNFAAMTDSSSPGSQVLIQAFTVPAGAVSVILSFDYFLNNLGPDYVPGSDLDFNDSPNQQASVDILSATAGAFDTTVLLNVFQTQSGDPLQPGTYQTLTADITATVAAGGTFQLRFAEVDSLQTLNFGVDNVQIDVTVPEPSGIALSAAGLVLLAWRAGRGRRAPDRGIG
ncbi:MAG: hypothetical protein ACLQVN_04140 [Bryobacteraceae bacterium]